MPLRLSKVAEAVSFDVVLEAGAWPAEDALFVYARRVCDALRDLAHGHITFVFTDDAHIQTLNRDWRQKDKPTNVLSFPDGDVGEDGAIHLGDVIVAHETLMRESAELGIGFDDHLTHLLLHGSLHLLGYDHIDDTEAEEMETLEIRLLAAMGIKDPYQNGDLALD
ncbi:MAG: rRNA maturation RNase YbeY [Proteobacteria bacterium]|nr:rRNA maturation RNase YbeY [Pseudomonadota bacterium]